MLSAEREAPNLIVRTCATAARARYAVPDAETSTRVARQPVRYPCMNMLQGEARRVYGFQLSIPGLHLTWRRRGTSVVVGGGGSLHVSEVPFYIATRRGHLPPITACSCTSTM